MKIIFLTIFLIYLLPTSSLKAQDTDRPNYFPIWTYHQSDINIHGISIGLLGTGDNLYKTYTNGVRIELIGLGFLYPFFLSKTTTYSEDVFEKMKSEDLSERINGLNISASGSICHCLTNGLLIGLVGHVNYRVNGITASMASNTIQAQNGFMVSANNNTHQMNGLQLGFVNGTRKLFGIQIGLFNYTDRAVGLQLGLWNVNSKRKLPIINWNFNNY